MLYVLRTLSRTIVWWFFWLDLGFSHDAQWLNDKADLVMAFHWVFLQISRLSFLLFTVSNGLWCVERIVIFFCRIFHIVFVIHFIILPYKCGTRALFSILLLLPLVLYNNYVYLPFWDFFHVRSCHRDAPFISSLRTIHNKNFWQTLLINV